MSAAVRRNRVAVNADGGLGETDALGGDAAVAACPTGSLLVKQVGFATPVGASEFDSTTQPIGSEIERPAAGE